MRNILYWVEDNFTKILIIVLSVLLLVAVVAYVNEEMHEPKSGYIIERQYTEPWVSVSSVDGKPYTVYHPATYCLIYDNDGRIGDACVPEMEYVSYKVGDYYP